MEYSVTSLLLEFNCNSNWISCSVAVAMSVGVGGSYSAVETCFAVTDVDGGGFGMKDTCLGADCGLDIGRWTGNFDLRVSRTRQVGGSVCKVP